MAVQRTSQPFTATLPAASAVGVRASSAAFQRSKGMDVCGVSYTFDTVNDYGTGVIRVFLEGTNAPDPSGEGFNDPRATPTTDPNGWTEINNSRAATNAKAGNDGFGQIASQFITVGGFRWLRLTVQVAEGLTVDALDFAAFFQGDYAVGA